VLAGHLPFPFLFFYLSVAQQFRWFLKSGRACDRLYFSPPFLFSPPFFFSCIRLARAVKEKQAPIFEWSKQSVLMSSPSLFLFFPLPFFQLCLAVVRRKESDCVKYIYCKIRQFVVVYIYYSFPFSTLLSSPKWPGVERPSPG